MIQASAKPRVLPHFAQLFTAPAGAFETNGRLPDRLRESCVTRQREFLAGRHCAAEALRSLGAAEWDVEIGTGAAGEPLWPAGYTGSITHTATMAASAVASLDDAVSIGIDLELVIDPARARRISHIVLHACETRLKAGEIDPQTVFTLAFSAKESLFKCLYPIVQRRFDYRDAALRRIDVRENRIEMELLTSLGGGYHRGRRFTGQFEVNAGLVSTGFCIPQASHEEDHSIL
jgi:enterobactin synthetase component D